MVTAVRAEDLLPTDAVITYQPSAGDGSLPLDMVIFEADDRFDRDRWTRGCMRVRHYPSGLNALSESSGSYPITGGLSNVRYSASTGTYEWTQEYRYREINITLEFSGSNSVVLPFPPQPWVSANSFFYMSPVGNFVDVSGWPGLPIFTVDYRSGEIKASFSCYGVLRLNYMTSYRILRYTPPAYIDFYGQAIYNNHGYGKMLAMQSNGAQRHVTSFQVPAPDINNQSIELYRIEYSVIVNGEGTWEKPTGWPTVGTYPGSDLVCDPNVQFMEVRRLLEVAYFSLSDPEIDNSSRGASNTVVPVPLDFTNLERNKGLDGWVSVVNGRVTASARDAQQSRAFRQDIRNFPPPKMRVVTHNYTASKPYDNVALNNNNGWRTYTVIDGVFIDTTETFRVLITITPGKIPFEVPAPTPADRVSKTSEDYQMGVVNNTIFRAWSAISWRAINQSILSRYPKSLFTYNNSAITNLIK